MRVLFLRAIASNAFYMEIREIEVAVISDLHLATHACKPKKILKYLKSIRTAVLVLNGDIVDSWRFRRNYFPKSHLKVIRQLIKMMEKGTRIYYVSGNHDEFLRKFSKIQVGNLEVVNQVILDLDGSKTWIFHGDIFDNIIHSTKALAKFGAAIYGLLTIINKLINRVLKCFNYSEIIIYKSLKKYFVREKKSPSKFENAIGEAAVAQGYNTIICGHTHIPKEKMLDMNGIKMKYLNCGDWVEHCTAVEYYNNEWHLYYQNEQEEENRNEETKSDELEIPAERQIYKTLVKELTFANIL